LNEDGDFGRQGPVDGFRSWGHYRRRNLTTSSAGRVLGKKSLVSPAFQQYGYAESWPQSLQ
jgi:hypothetical protein